MGSTLFAIQHTVIVNYLFITKMIKAKVVT